MRLMTLSLTTPGITTVFTLLAKKPGNPQNGKKTLEWSTILDTLTILTVLTKGEYEAQSAVLPSSPGARTSTLLTFLQKAGQEPGTSHC